MVKIDGRAIARNVIDRLRQRPAPQKSLVGVLVGVDPASIAFLGQKAKISQELNISFQLRRLPLTVSQSELEQVVADYSADPTVGGIIVQLPLPVPLDQKRVLMQVVPEKDVDALAGVTSIQSPIVGVVEEILGNLRLAIKDLKMIAVVGRGFLVGKPIINWLEHERLKIEDLRLKIADSKTQNLQEFLKDADIVITGVGKKDLIDVSKLKEGVIAIDFGFPPDLNISNLSSEKSGYYTPTPSGTGPILVAKILENFYDLN